MQIPFHLALLPTLIIASFPVTAADTQDNGEHYTATLPTVTVVGQSDTSVLKGYINYERSRRYPQRTAHQRNAANRRYAQYSEKQKLRHERFEFHP